MALNVVESIVSIQNCFSLENNIMVLIYSINNKHACYCYNTERNTIILILFFRNREVRRVWLELLAQNSALLPKFEDFIMDVVSKLEQSRADCKQIHEKMKR